MAIALISDCSEVIRAKQDINVKVLMCHHSVVPAAPAFQLCSNTRLLIFWNSLRRQSKHSQLVGVCAQHCKWNTRLFFGEIVLCQLCWNCAILISSTASQIWGAACFLSQIFCYFNFLWHGSSAHWKRTQTEEEATSLYTHATVHLPEADGKSITV